MSESYSGSLMTFFPGIRLLGRDNIDFREGGGMHFLAINKHKISSLSAGYSYPLGDASPPGTNPESSLLMAYVNL